MTSWILAAVACFAGLGPGSDVRLEGVRLQRFLETKGESEVGVDVAWKVPSLVFAVPRRQKDGHALFVCKGVGILVPAGLAGREEIERRGGLALIRGRVERVPKGRAKKGDPTVIVVARELTRRRGN